MYQAACPLWKMPLIEEILHHLGCIKLRKSWDNGIHYQLQLVGRISSIN